MDGRWQTSWKDIGTGIRGYQSKSPIRCRIPEGHHGVSRGILGMAGLLIVADEDVDNGIIRSLRLNGNTVRAIIEEMSGIPDEEVVHVAICLNALLITQDKGYGRHVRRYGMPPQGLVLVRSAGWSSARKALTVLEFPRDYSDRLVGTFAVIDTGGTRIAHWP